MKNKLWLAAVFSALFVITAAGQNPSASTTNSAKDYLILNYKISDIPADLVSPPLPNNLAAGATIYVILAPRGKFHEVVRASMQPITPAAGEVVLQGHNVWAWDSIAPHSSVHVTYGLERFYVAEGTGNPSGTLTGQVAVSKTGSASIKQVFVDGKPYVEAMKLKVR